MSDDDLGGLDWSVLWAPSFAQRSYPCGAHQIVLKESVASSTDFDRTGELVWPGAVYVSAFLASEEGQAVVRGKRVLEMGSGTGLGGLAALLGGGASFCAFTDHNEAVLALLRDNVDAASYARDRSAVESLEWGEPVGDLVRRIGPIDVVLAADVFYDMSLFDRLIGTTKAILVDPSHARDSDASGVLVAAFKLRAANAVSHLYDVLQRHGFSTRLQVDLGQADEKDENPIRILVSECKREADASHAACT